MILADGYPDELTAVDQTTLDEAAAKGLQLYVEYPAWLPDMEPGEAKDVGYERGVVASEMFGPSLPPMAIVLDLLLPQESGWAFLAEMKANPSLQDIPVIVVTIVDNQKDRGMIMGAHDYAVKPVRRRWLLDYHCPQDKIDHVDRIVRKKERESIGME